MNEEIIPILILYFILFFYYLTCHLPVLFVCLLIRIENSPLKKIKPLKQQVKLKRLSLLAHPPQRNQVCFLIFVK